MEPPYHKETAQITSMIGPNPSYSLASSSTRKHSSCWINVNQLFPGISLSVRNSTPATFISQWIYSIVRDSILLLIKMFFFLEKKKTIIQHQQIFEKETRINCKKAIFSTIVNMYASYRKTDIIVIWKN
jgi:hypothetical protein